MNQKSTLLLCSALALSLLTGCRSDKCPVTPTQQGALGGAAIGGLTGGIWANNGGILDTGEGVAVGAAAGGLVGALVGDAVDEYGSTPANEDLNKKIADLEAENARLKGELDNVAAQPPAEPAEPLAGIDNVKIEKKDGQIRFTILSEVLFDSGKASLRGNGLETLNKVLAVIEKEFPDRQVYVEGHTDSDPIQHSNWKSNWDLSYARSMAVVNHFIANKGVAAERLQAVACGEFHPAYANDNADNKRRNRRAVIVVMPPKDSMVIGMQ